MHPEHAPLPSPLVVDGALRQRVTEAVIAQAGIRHDSLNAFLRRRLSGTDVPAGALFAEPAVEGLGSYTTSGLTPAALSGSLLHPRLVAALGSKGGEYTFDYPAYAHQLEAWRHLRADDTRSVLVSSGTGSGKTECFLIPLLDDLAREAEGSGRLTGVRALMLYPLNALIASQEERLRQWTRPFKGDVRFALYNGLMMEDARRGAREAAEDRTPEQVLYRRTLRDDPPPVLVTNITMLEYMTIRQVDAPILESSRGKLRWIIIDEAHSYIGSAAAEIALLLRRVMLAFEVDPDTVRFVATSATIGGAGEAARVSLQRYLSDLAGVRPEQVHVVFGSRQTVSLPPADLSGSRSPHLLSRGPVQAFIRTIEGAPLSLSKVEEFAGAAGLSAAGLIDGISAERRGDGAESPPLLPMRVHKFLRAVPGLWSCLNPKCGGERPDNWPFGSLHFERCEKCSHCTATVLELLSCQECGEPWLSAEEMGQHLRQTPLSADPDEFAAASAREVGEAADDDDVEVARKQARIRSRVLVASRQLPGLSARPVDPLTGLLFDRRDQGTTIWCSSLDAVEAACPHCRKRPLHDSSGPLWPFRFGAPFLMQNAALTMLEGVSSKADAEHTLPGDGRQLLSFSDSRQGTARFAANMETFSERGFVRGFIYHAVQKAGTAPDREERGRILQDIEKIEATVPREFREQLISPLRSLLGQDTIGVTWNDLRLDLARETIVKRWIGRVWDADRDERFHGNPENLAEFLLLRELLRRPRRANAVETLGLAKLDFPALNKISDGCLPSSWKDRGGTAEGWRDFLYFLIDAVLRSNFAVRINQDDVRWLLPRDAMAVNVVGYGEDKRDRSDITWPRARPGGVKSNAVLALEAGLGLDTVNAEDRAMLDDILREAWRQIEPLVRGAGSTYALDLTKARVAPVTAAWQCPVTRRVLPRLVFGRTPYGLRGKPPGFADAPMSIQFPHLPVVFPKTPGERQRMASFLAADGDVQALRQAGIWTNLHDRAANYSPYIRAEEHSAQQPPHRLREFENEFKRGEINLLACSTTMEMGVDIGSIEAVVNTNVPPSIANYLQRVGRAGRRGQSFASSLTFARATPLDRETFSDPVKYLQRSLRAPSVKLGSDRIAQRHVNALLLAIWLRTLAGDLTRLRVGEFFGLPASLTLPEEMPSKLTQFSAWLSVPGTFMATRPAIKTVLRGTALPPGPATLAITREMFECAGRQICEQWRVLRSNAAALEAAARTSTEFQVKRLCQEQLLGELSKLSVLPGHGFPNAVVPFINDCAARRQRRNGTGDDDGETRRNRRYDYPARNADVAIREYAPGSEIVLDGLVWQSAGVTLNWERAAFENGPPEIQSIKWSWICDRCGEADCGRDMPQACSACGAADVNRHQFLEPAGFRVDWFAQPRADVDRVTYIPPIPALVSAREARWEPLLDPALGRGRASASGLVFNQSLGQARRGYKVCLECGRAAEDGDQALAEHDALMPRRGEARRCRGNDRAYAITNSMAFGAEMLTDVAEFQPTDLTDEAAAWAIAAALREALSRQLGMEPRELGMSVARRQNAAGGETYSIFLFDQSAGGAGYAPRLFDDLPGTLQEAAHILDCPAKCIRACSACVLSSDLYAQQAVIDRVAALGHVTKLLASMARPAPGDQVPPDAKMSPPVADVIVRRCTGASQIAVWAGPDFDIAALAEPPFSLMFGKAHSNGATMWLVIPEDQLKAMDEASRRGLRNIAIRQGFVVCSGEAEVAGNGARLLATLEESGSNIGFFSRDPMAASLGPGWGVGRTHPVVTASCDKQFVMAPVDEAFFERSVLPGDRVLVVTEQPARPLRLIGSSLLRNYLEPELKAAGLWHPGQLVELHYNDRYLKSPLPALIAFRTFAALRDALASPKATMPLTILTDEIATDRNSGSLYKLTQNWQSDADRRAVCERLAGHFNFRLKLSADRAGHGRKLVLTYQDGSSGVVWFDQGFGYWRVPPSTRHEFSKNAAYQAKALLDASAPAAGIGESYIAFKRA